MNRRVRNDRIRSWLRVNDLALANARLDCAHAYGMCLFDTALDFSFDVFMRQVRMARTLGIVRMWRGTREPREGTEKLRDRRGVAIAG